MENKLRPKDKPKPCPDCGTIMEWREAEKPNWIDLDLLRGVPTYGCTDRGMPEHFYCEHCGKVIEVEPPDTCHHGN